VTSLAITKRQAIATALKTEFADMPGGWSVYPSQQDTVSLPCVVVGARDPYRQPLTFADAEDGRQREQLNLFIGLYHRRDTGNTALDIFDEACDRVLAALASVTYSCGWDSFTPPGGLEVDGVPALGSSVDIEVV
jgi:hypothetical protein